MNLTALRVGASGWLDTTGDVVRNGDGLLMVKSVE